METSATAKPTEPSGVLVELDRLGVAYRQVPQFALTRLSEDRRVQVREQGHYAPKEEVERYAAQMLGGAVFPPIVVTNDDWLVDGNTRVGACELNRKRGKGFHQFPAFLIEEGFGKATERRQHLFHALAATINNRNGRALTKKEQLAETKHMLALDWKVEQISRALGATPAAVATLRRQAAAAEKLVRVGIDPEQANGALRPALRSLGAEPAIRLNDEPFKALAVLAGEAGLTSSDSKTFAAQAVDKGSDAGAMEVLANARVARADQIRQKALTGVGHPPTAAMLRQHLGFVVKYAGNERVLVEHNQGDWTRHLDVVERALSILREVRTAQIELTK